MAEQTSEGEAHLPKSGKYWIPGVYAHLLTI